MPTHLIVEPLGEDIITLAHCMLIDALSFPRPGLIAARDLRRTGFRAWVCRSTDDPAPWGFLGAQRSREALHITAVAASPERRRKGVGLALMRTAILQARQARLPRVTLEVRPDNEEAIQLYEKLAFTVSGKIPEYYGPGDDAISMVLSLAQPRPRLRTR
jgi:ribosomal protein S18 acetylase RimI-like enzyme